MKKHADILSRKDKITYLPLDRITANRNQPRRKFNSDELQELAMSIRENGVLQPITVRLVNREYCLIAGERRLRAAHIAGLREIPCIVIEADDKSSATLALLENLQRSDLSFFEEAEGIAHLMRVCGYTQEDVAKKLGKSQSAVSNKLRLLRLGQEIISKIIDSDLTERHARALLRLNTREERLAAVEHITENELNVYQTDEYIESLLSRNEDKKREQRRRKQQYVIKDVRLFYNTVDRAVDTMRRAGVRADLVRDEDETSINMSIRIFK